MSTPYPPTAPAPQPASSPVGPVVPAGKPPKTFADRFARFVLVLVVLSIVGFALYTWAALNYTYSEGERVGFARKLSNKGWVCKTWEGEISVTNSVGAQESVFAFTVRDPAVVEKFRALEGKQVTVLYKERVGIPSSCFGDTPYHAYDVRGIK
jgi:hypothetical protein